ncbi:MAG: ABC transporter ATP-binding protein [Acidobacteriota bacterium]
MTNRQRMLYYYRRYWRKLLIGSLCVIFSAVTSLLAPKIVGYAVDDLLKQVTHNKLLIYGLLVLAVSAVRGIFLYSQRWIIVTMSRDIENDLRNDYYEHLQRLPLSFFQQTRTGDLMARATNDLNAVRMLIGPAVMYGLNTIFVSIIALPVMISISGRLTLLILLSLPFISLATRYFSKHIHDRFEGIQEYFSTITARAQENLAGVRVVRAYVQEEHEIAEFDHLNREYVKRNLKLIRLTGLFMPTLRALIGIGPGLVLWYGGLLVSRGVITVGQFVEFNLYLVLLIWPMIALGWVINLYQRGMASMGRINAILNTEPTIKDVAEKSSVENLEGAIEFRNLTFAYNGHSVLKNINVKIEPGQTIAIVGHTGSGKSTLINLIPRLFDATPGQVLIDGRPINEIPLDVLRHNIGYVPQDTFLFSNSIKSNIAFGVEKASLAEVEEVTQQAGLLNDIRDFPEGFDTVIGERGITLSGGQKQRSAIARALIRQPKILILDDALSAVDTETEERILTHLRDVMSERTSIIVSHRISTVKTADLILVLAHGEIVERGTHKQLLEHGGVYAELYEKQLLEEELAAS